MPNGSNERLPEGTDAIIAGASSTDFTPAIPLEAEPAGTGAAAASANTGDFRARATAAAAAADLRAQASERTADLRGQAGDKAREFAEQGRDRATAALDNVSRLIDDAAAQVDEKVGREYGDYARRAADAVDGFANTLRDKDIDELFADARELVKRSPGIAIGAAAVVGFALVRLVKAGAATAGAVASDDIPAPTATGSRKSSGKKKG